MAFLIAPVTDFNEITYHMIDVVRSFLTVTKVRGVCLFVCLFHSL